MIPRILAACVRALAWTWRVEQPPWPVQGPCVVALWHGDQVPMVALHRRLGLSPLASLSKDGELAARASEALGYRVLRGSSSRGGREALLAALATLRAGGRPTFTVDGPRGPAGVVQPGAEALARRVGVPVVWGGIDAAPEWRARSWDRLRVPLPFAKVRVRYGVWTGAEGTLADAMAPPA